MKWRNSEGREFSAGVMGHAEVPSFAICIPPDAMRELGYELVEKEEPVEEFELECIVWKLGVFDYSLKILRDDRLIPGKTYMVREKR